METYERTEIDPAEYFNPERPVPNIGLIKKLWYPTVISIVGVTSACFLNMLRRRPAFSGIQQHIIGGSLGLILGTTLDNYMDRKMAHRDKVLFEYIRSHPDDFPIIQRKKYGEVLESWVPIR